MIIINKMAFSFFFLFRVSVRLHKNSAAIGYKYFIKSLKYGKFGVGKTGVKWDSKVNNAAF